MFYTRPRMYLFTYAYSDEDTNELYAEYHLSRQVRDEMILEILISFYII